MTDITIPPEALEAAAKEIAMQCRCAMACDWRDHMGDARAACLAMLKAWPGMTTDGRELHFSTARGAPVTTVKAYSIILPLPQKETSA